MRSRPNSRLAAAGQDPRDGPRRDPGRGRVRRGMVRGRNGWTGSPTNPGRERRAPSPTPRWKRWWCGPWKRSPRAPRTGPSGSWPAGRASRRPACTASAGPSGCSHSARRTSKISPDPRLSTAVRWPGSCRIVSSSRCRPRQAGQVPAFSHFPSPDMPCYATL
jgi:hypothetical protein